MNFDRMPVPLAAARRLQQMILSGEIAPDERLPSQRVLSERLGVSRASLREALLTLETLGLVRTLPARGTFVVGAERAASGAPEAWRFAEDFALSEVFQSRLLIEVEIARLAAPVFSQAQVDLLNRYNADFESHWRDGDLVRMPRRISPFTRESSQPAPIGCCRGSTRTSGRF